MVSTRAESKVWRPSRTFGLRLGVLITTLACVVFAWLKACHEIQRLSPEAFNAQTRRDFPQREIDRTSGGSGRYYLNPVESRDDSVH